MERITVSKLFGGYLYGPADLRDIELGDGYVRLRLQDSTGRALSAIYRGCAYWPITPNAVGSRFAIVQEVEADKLTSPEYANILLDLQKRGSPAELLQKWETEGYHFYMHRTNERGVDYLVAAREVSVDG